MSVHRELIRLEALGRVLGSVVRSLSGIGLDRDRLGGAARGHVQSALGSLDVVVVCLGAVLVTPLGNRAVARAGLGLGAGELGGGDTLPANELVGGTGGNLPIGGHERAAIIGLACILRLDGHFALLDSERAVLRSYVELAGHIVAVGILDHGGSSDLVFIRTSIGSGGSSAQPLDGEGRALIVGIGGTRHAGNRVLVPVVSLRVRVGGNCDLVLVLIGTCVDYQLAKNKLDIIVVEVGGRRIRRIELVLVFTGKDVVLVVPSELVLRQDTVIANKAVAADVLANIGTALDRLAVIVLVAVLGRKDNGALGDAELAVSDIEFDVGVVAVAGRELALVQAHRISTGIGALGFRGAAELDVVLAHAGGQARDVITGDGLLVAVVLLATVVTDDGNGHLVGDGADHKLAVLHAVDDVLSTSVNGADGAVSKVGRIRAGVGAGSTDLNRREVRAVGRARETRDALLLAVVGLGVGVGRKVDVLVVVHINNVVAMAVNGDGSVLIGNRGVTRDALRDIGRLDLGAPCGALGLGVRDLLLGAVQVVVDRVLGGVLLVPEDDRVVALAKRMLDGVRAILLAVVHQVITIDSLGGLGLLDALLAITSHGVGQLIVRADLLVLHHVGLELLPVSLDGHVAGRHGEGGAAVDRRGIGQTLNRPTGELATLAGGLALDRLGRALLRRVHGCVGVAPRTAIEVVDNLETTDILRVEIDGAVDRIRERHRLSEVLVQVPPREGVGGSAYLLGRGELLVRYVRRLGGAAGHIVLGALLGELSTARVAQVILHERDVLALDGNVAVEVLVRVGPVVPRDLCRDEGNLLHIVLGEINARELRLDGRLVVLVDLLPRRRVPQHDVRAVRPRDHALVNVVEAVPVARPRGAVGVHRRDAVGGAPVALVVGVCILGRVEQVVDLRPIGRRAGRDDRHVLGCGDRRTVGIVLERNRDRCRALADAGDVAAVIDRQDVIVGRRPLKGPRSTLGIDRRRQPSAGELRNGIGTGNRNGLRGLGG